MQSSSNSFLWAVVTIVVALIQFAGAVITSRSKAASETDESNVEFGLFTIIISMSSGWVIGGIIFHLWSISEAVLDTFLGYAAWGLIAGASIGLTMKLLSNRFNWIAIVALLLVWIIAWLVQYMGGWLVDLHTPNAFTNPLGVALALSAIPCGGVLTDIILREAMGLPIKLDKSIGIFLLWGLVWLLGVWVGGETQNVLMRRNLNILPLGPMLQGIIVGGLGNTFLLLFL